MPILTPGDVMARPINPPDKQLLIDQSGPGPALTAFATGGQANATALTNQLNRVAVVGTIADSVKLPGAVAGTYFVTVINAAALSMNVFPQTGDAINALAVNTAFAMAGGKTALFFCSVNGTWSAVLSA